MLVPRPAKDEIVAKSGLIHRVYLPPRTEGEKKPLVVMLHGRTGNASSMWYFSKVLDQLKPVVVSPQGPFEHPMGGYSWWNIDGDPLKSTSGPQATTSEHLQPSLDKLEHFISVVQEVYSVDSSSIFGLGFSQGAALLAALSLRQPSLFKGVAILSGYIPSVSILLENQKRREGGAGETLPAYFIAHGTEDEVLPVERAEETRDVLQGFGAKVTFFVDSAVHKTSSAAVRLLGQWFQDLW